MAGKSAGCTDFNASTFSRKRGIGDAGGIGGDKFFADIAGKVLVFGFPLLGLRIKKNHALQVGQKLLCRTGQQGSHVVQIHPAFFIQRNEQRFFGRANGLNRLFVVDGAFAENGRL